MPRSRLRITGWDVVDCGGRGIGEGEDGDVGEEEEEEEGEEEMMDGEEKEEEKEEEEEGLLYGVKRKKGYPRMGDVDAVLVTGSRMCITSFS